MWKRFLCITFFAILFSCLTIVFAENPPTIQSNMLKDEYIVYKNNAGLWRFVTSDSELYLVKSVDNNNTFSTSKTIIQNPTIYMWEDAQWKMWENTSCILGIGFVPTIYFTNHNIEQYLLSNGSLLNATFFPSAPLITVPLMIHHHGGHLLQGASQTSLIVLVTGLILLAILAGVFLIPRVIHLFL